MTYRYLWAVFSSYFACLAFLIACSSATPKVVLRDARIYQTELDFLQMALRQSHDLLESHLRRGTCICSPYGDWSDPVCEDTAKTILVLEKRVVYHIWMMEYNAGLRKEPLMELPDLGHPSELCPPSMMETEARDVQI